MVKKSNAKNSSKDNSADKKAKKGEEGGGDITNSKELKKFLVSIREKMAEEVGSPIYALTALNYVMNMANINTLLDKESKEVARDIWLRLRQSGFQLRQPPLLFDADEEDIIPEVTP